MCRQLLALCLSSDIQNFVSSIWYYQGNNSGKSINLAKFCKQNLIWARKTTSSTFNFLKPLLIIQVWKMNVSISEILVRSKWPNKRRAPLCSEYFNDSEAVARLSTAMYTLKCWQMYMWLLSMRNIIVVFLVIMASGIELPRCDLWTVF